MSATNPEIDAISVLLAERIITMDPSRPTAPTRAAFFGERAA